MTGTPAAIYDFTVPLQRSGWTIIVGGQALRPQYSGSVWLEKSSGQVRRIEFQADKIPKDFPDDSVQTAVDYQANSFGHGNVSVAGACGEHCVPAGHIDLQQE